MNIEYKSILKKNFWVKIRLKLGLIIWLKGIKIIIKIVHKIKSHRRYFKKGFNNKKIKRYKYSLIKIQWKIDNIKIKIKKFLRKNIITIII